MQNQTEQNLTDIHHLIPIMREQGQVPENSTTLLSMAKRVVKATGKLTGRVDDQFFSQALGYALLHRFVEEDRLIDEQQTARAVASAIRFVEDQLETRTHHLPIHLDCVPADQQIDIGPVIFYPLTSFAAHQRHPERLQEWVGQADLVAEVSIPKCHETLSMLRAQQVVERARDMVRFLTESSSGQDWQAVKAGHDPINLDSFALSLNAIADPDCSWPLALRLLDAIGWYSIGSREQSTAASLTLWVNALERLTMTVDHDHLTDVVARRTACLCYLCDPTTDYSYWLERSNSLYEIRCDLVHGGIGPFDPGLNEHASSANLILQKALLGAVQFFRTIGIEQIHFSSKALEKAYLEMEKRVETC